MKFRVVVADDYLSYLCQKNDLMDPDRRTYTEMKAMLDLLKNHGLREDDVDNMERHDVLFVQLVELANHKGLEIHNVESKTGKYRIQKYEGGGEWVETPEQIEWTTVVGSYLAKPEPPAPEEQVKADLTKLGILKIQ